MVIQIGAPTLSSLLLSLGFLCLWFRAIRNGASTYWTYLLQTSLRTAKKFTWNPDLERNYLFRGLMRDRSERCSVFSSPMPTYPCPSPSVLLDTLFTIAQPQDLREDGLAPGFETRLFALYTRPVSYRLAIRCDVCSATFPLQRYTPPEDRVSIPVMSRHSSTSTQARYSTTKPRNSERAHNGIGT
jgi:hypothetical protein